MVVSNFHGDMESRFGHLIQPIRDLTKNWNVDIASELEDYLEEIEKISITFDDGTTTMNFAEAALLIQGSTCIYSKKVEYLYTLVYQVLDLLASKKKLQQASSVDGEGNDNDANFGNKKEQDEEFLSLDDIGNNCKNLDLKDDNDDFDGVSTVPHTPLVLIPLGEKFKGDNPLISKTGEVLGNRNDFKMNTSIVHTTGTMLLDMSHLSLLELSLSARPHSTPYPKRTVTVTGTNGEAPGLQMNLSNENEDIPEPPANDEPLPMDMSMDDNEGGVDIPETNNHTVNEQSRHDRMQLRKRDKKNYLVAPTMPANDPWVTLDPHQGDLTEKQFKKSKMFRVPKTLEVDTRKKRKRNNIMNGKEITPITQYCTTVFFSHAKDFPHNPLKAPTFLEFEHHFWKEYRRRQTQLRKEKQKLIAEGRLRELAEEEIQENDNAPNAGILNDEGDEDNDDDFQVPEIQVPDIQDIGPMQFGTVETSELPVQEGVEDILDSHIVTSYEELVRRYVDGFLASAQQYAHITDLSKRVHEWEDKVIPKLKDEESREPFDIHKYGTRILDSLGKNTKVATEKTGKKPETIYVPFRKVVENKEPFQVCRAFLATLQLANNYNVEIHSDSVLDKCIDTMALKLLSTKRQFEELLEYQAPSLQK